MRFCRLRRHSKSISRQPPARSERYMVVRTSLAVPVSSGLPGGMRSPGSSEEDADEAVASTESVGIASSLLASPRRSRGNMASCCLCAAAGLLEVVSDHYYH